MYKGFTFPSVEDLATEIGREFRSPNLARAIQQKLHYHALRLPKDVGSFAICGCEKRNPKKCSCQQDFDMQFGLIDRLLLKVGSCVERGTGVGGKTVAAGVFAKKPGARESCILLESDLDEIPSRRALRVLRHCESSSTTERIYATLPVRGFEFSLGWTNGFRPNEGPIFVHSSRAQIAPGCSWEQVVERGEGVKGCVVRSSRRRRVTEDEEENLSDKTRLLKKKWSSSEEESYPYGGRIAAGGNFAAPLSSLLRDEENISSAMANNIDPDTLTPVRLHIPPRLHTFYEKSISLRRRLSPTRDRPGQKKVAHVLTRTDGLPVGWHLANMLDGPPGLAHKFLNGRLEDHPTATVAI